MCRCVFELCLTYTCFFAVCCVFLLVWRSCIVLFVSCCFVFIIYINVCRFLATFCFWPLRPLACCWLLGWHKRSGLSVNQVAFGQKDGVRQETNWQTDKCS